MTTFIWAALISFCIKTLITLLLLWKSKKTRALFLKYFFKVKVFFSKKKEEEEEDIEYIPMNPPRSSFLKEDRKERSYKREKEPIQEKPKNIVQKILTEKQKIQDDPVIVGIEKPKGAWSEFIMRQKLTFMKARMLFENTEETKNMGFWERIARAQSLSQGKDQSPTFYQDSVKQSRKRGRGGRGL